MLLLIVIIIFFIVIGSLTSGEEWEAYDKERKAKRARIYDVAPSMVQCRCMQCNKVVRIPKERLKLDYYGKQRIKCPKCVAMTLGRIVDYHRVYDPGLPKEEPSKTNVKASFSVSQTPVVGAAQVEDDYDVQDYIDAEDFADEWESDFDSREEAMEYWEDNF